MNDDSLDGKSELVIHLKTKHVWLIVGGIVAIKLIGFIQLVVTGY